MATGEGKGNRPNPTPFYVCQLLILEKFSKCVSIPLNLNVCELLEVPTVQCIQAQQIKVLFIFTTLFHGLHIMPQHSRDVSAPPSNLYTQVCAQLLTLHLMT